MKKIIIFIMLGSSLLYSQQLSCMRFGKMNPSTGEMFEFSKTAQKEGKITLNIQEGKKVTLMTNGNKASFDFHKENSEMAVYHSSQASSNLLKFKTMKGSWAVEIRHDNQNIFIMYECK